MGLQVLYLLVLLEHYLDELAVSGDMGEVVL